MRRCLSINIPRMAAVCVGGARTLDPFDSTAACYASPMDKAEIIERLRFFSSLEGRRGNTKLIEVLLKPRRA
jgi:hypothetical protein